MQRPSLRIGISLGRSDSFDRWWGMTGVGTKQTGWSSTLNGHCRPGRSTSQLGEKRAYRGRLVTTGDLPGRQSIASTSRSTKKPPLKLCSSEGRFYSLAIAKPSV